MRLLVWLGMAVAGVSFISADSAADSASLELEHRSAKGGDSFLDGIAHLFGGTMDWSIFMEAGRNCASPKMAP